MEKHPLNAIYNTLMDNHAKLLNLLDSEAKEKNIASIKTITAAGFEQINSVQSGYLRYKFKL